MRHRNSVGGYAYPREANSAGRSKVAVERSERVMEMVEEALREGPLS